MDALLAHCSAAFSQHAGLFAIFFLGGLTGGFTHCLTMCGPMIACQTIASNEKSGARQPASERSGGCSSGGCNKFARMRRMSGWPYHLGRATTYGALGFFSALLSRQVEASSVWPWLSTIMLACAGGLFIFSSIPGCKHTLLKLSGKRTYFYGALLGFMPCGLLYAAVMIAATLANPWLGMVAMWLFVLGTLPALFITSVGTELLTHKWQKAMMRVGGIVSAFNGVSLLIMAEKIVR